MTTPLRPRFRQRLRALLPNLALGLGSFVVVLLVAELAVRLLAPQQLIQIRPDVWQPADTVGWLHRPNVNTRINTGERTVHIYTDAEGFRVGAQGRGTEGRRVLILGDSFMEALQVDHEQSFAGLLEARLPAATGAPVAVRNDGVGGFGTSHYLLRARALLPRDDYALVITALFVGNDAQTQRLEYLPPRAPVERFRFRLPRRLAWREVVNATLRPLNDLLEVRSHLFLLFKNRLQTLRMRTGLASRFFPTEFRTSEATSPRWTITADLCREISELASAHGARALFVLIPTEFQVDSTELRQYIRGYGVDPAAIDLDQPNRRLAEELSARGLTVIDPLPDFRAAFAAGVRLYGSVDRHLTPEGHRRLAELALPAAAHALSARGH
jgi:lysophospholipase L1-like esterase